jgi:hypothetical protein
MLIWEHSPQLRLIGLVCDDALREPTLARPRFRRQDMARKSVTPGDLARTRLLEALRRTLMCLQLWHKLSWKLLTSGWSARSKTAFRQCRRKQSGTTQKL